MKSVPQSLLPSNSSGLGDNAEVGVVVMELLNRSVLYRQPVDPVYWWGALRKCEGRILPCLQVQRHTLTTTTFNSETVFIYVGLFWPKA